MDTTPKCEDCRSDLVWIIKSNGATQRTCIVCEESGGMYEGDPGLSVCVEAAGHVPTTGGYTGGGKVSQAQEQALRLLRIACEKFNVLFLESRMKDLLGRTKVTPPDAAAYGAFVITVRTAFYLKDLDYLINLEDVSTRCGMNKYEIGRAVSQMMEQLSDEEKALARLGSLSGGIPRIPKPRRSSQNELAGETVELPRDLTESEEEALNDVEIKEAEGIDAEEYNRNFKMKKPLRDARERHVIPSMLESEDFE